MKKPVTFTKKQLELIAKMCYLIDNFGFSQLSDSELETKEQILKKST